MPGRFEYFDCRIQKRQAIYLFIPNHSEIGAVSDIFISLLLLYAYGRSKGCLENLGVGLMSHIRVILSSTLINLNTNNNHIKNTYLNTTHLLIE